MGKFFIHPNKTRCSQIFKGALRLLNLQGWHGKQLQGCRKIEEISENSNYQQAFTFASEPHCLGTATAAAHNLVRKRSNELRHSNQQRQTSNDKKRKIYHTHTNNDDKNNSQYYIWNENGINLQGWLQTRHNLTRVCWNLRPLYLESSTPLQIRPLLASTRQPDNTVPHTHFTFA